MDALEKYVYGPKRTLGFYRLIGFLSVCQLFHSLLTTAVPLTYAAVNPILRLETFSFSKMFSFMNSSVTVRTEVVHAKKCLRYDVHGLRQVALVSSFALITDCGLIRHMGSPIKIRNLMKLFQLPLMSAIKGAVNQSVVQRSSTPFNVMHVD